MKYKGVNCTISPNIEKWLDDCADVDDFEKQQKQEAKKNKPYKQAINNWRNKMNKFEPLAIENLSLIQIKLLDKVLKLESALIDLSKDVDKMYDGMCANEEQHWFSHTSDIKDKLDKILDKEEK